MLLKNNKYWNYVETYLSQILDMITDPVIIIDKEGTVIYVNQGYERQVGTSKERVLGRNLYDYFPNDKLLEVLHTGEFIDSEEHYNETLGYRIVAGFLPMRDEKGEVVAVAGIGTTSSIYKIYTRLNPVFSFNTEERSTFVSKEELPLNFQELLGEDPKFINCLSIAAKVADSDAPIMLRGETGVGKEVVAEAIHKVSKDNKSPFVAVNCAAIPENLIESELFGYEPGAFTGAQSSGKKGKIELAQQGTLFLDEVGDLTLSAQVKLLRFIQEKYIERIGGTNQIPVNTRIIAATNKNLEQMMQQGEFRSDLYFRLNVIPIYIPPLRERYADIPILAQYFLEQYCSKYNKQLSFSHDIWESLQNYSWPGNIRELQNVIEHAVVTSSGKKVTPVNLKFPFNKDVLESTESLNLNSAVEHTERAVIKKALEKAQNNKSKAIEYLGISRGSFYAKLQKYQLDP